MGVSLLESFDTNDDGKLTQAEIDAARKANLTKFDTDGNGELSLDEYQALWADAMRRAMVRQFQANDATATAASRSRSSPPASRTSSRISTATATAS